MFSQEFYFIVESSSAEEVEERAKRNNRQHHVVVMCIAHAMGMTEYCAQCGSLHIKDIANAHECSNQAAMRRGTNNETLAYALFSGRLVIFYAPNAAGSHFL